MATPTAKTNYEALEIKHTSRALREV